MSAPAHPASSWRTYGTCHVGIVVVCILACDGSAGSSRLPPPAPIESNAALYTSVAGEPCRLPAPSSSRSDTLRLQQREYPCRLVFRPTGVVLRGDTARGWPDPGAMVARSSDGRFFSSVTGGGGRIAVWNADGSFNRMLANPGNGPGELPDRGGGVLVAVDSADNIHVRSSGGQWSVFRSDYTFVSRSSITRSLPSWVNTVVLSEGAVLHSTPPTRNSPSFHVTGLDGRIRRSFEVPTSEQGAGATSGRAIATTGDSLFWAGPIAGALQGYVLNKYTTFGTKLMTIRRDAPWFRDLPGVPGGGYGQMPAPGPPHIHPVQIDRDGLLLISTWLSNSDWQPSAPGTGLTNPPPITQNQYLEVIDPRSGTVLASEVILSVRTGFTAPRGYFPGTRLAFRFDEAEDGATSVHVVEYFLLKS